MSIIRRKHWEIFLTLLIVELVVNFFIETIVVEYFGITPFNKLYGVIRFFLTGPIYFSYPFWVALELSKKLSRQDKFIQPSNLWLIVPATLLISSPLFSLYPVRPPIWMLMFVAAISLFCMLKLFAIPARQLKSIELKRNAGIWEYTPEIVQFLLWPLGVWWLQPVINRLVVKETIITE